MQENLDMKVRDFTLFADVSPIHSVIRRFIDHKCDQFTYKNSTLRTMYVVCIQFLHTKSIPNLPNLPFVETIPQG